MTVGQLIDEFARDEKLHILEVATFFGATQAYIERGYQEYLCINSFRRKVLRRMRQKHLILILETRKEKGSLRF